MRIKHLLAAALLLAIGGAGCTDSSDDGLTSANPANAMTADLVPADGELQQQLQLSEQQMADLAPALSAWRLGIKSADNEDAATCDRFTRRQERHERLMQLLEESAAVMTTDQFVDLVEMIAERIEERRESRRGQGTRPGRGAGGGFRYGAGGGHSGRIHGRDGFLAEAMSELGLTDAQMQQITEFRQNLRAECDGPASDPAGRHERRQRIREQMHEFLETVLTADQLAALEELLATYHQERLEDCGGRILERAARRIEFLTNVLLLDAAQVEQVTQIVNNAAAALSELRESVGGEDFDPEAHHEQARQIRQDAIDAIRAMLDEDRLRRFDALLSLPHGPSH